MRVLALIDMDSFYTQVEVKLDASLRGQPVVVVQYNPYGDLRTLKPTDVRLFPDSNGSIIASSYEARKFGVKRNMMAQAAKKLCPELKIVQVPVAHGKADLTIYREAGAQVINVLSSGAVCERASIDEAYLDVTAGAQQMLAEAAASSTGKEQHVKQQPAEQGQQGGEQLQHQEPLEAGSTAPQASTAVDAADGVAPGSVAGGVLVTLPESVEGWHVAGMPPGAAGVVEWWQHPDKSQDEQLLAAGAVIVARLRAAVAQQLGFSCSAGIAHSKILAKLGAGLNKPAQQTLVPATAVADLLNPLPISKLRALGGKFGEEIATSLAIQTVGELAAVPASRLEALVGEESAAWLTRLAQGIDDLEVKPRTLPKSISCGKTFRGGNAITGLSAVHRWLQELGQELQERIDVDRKDHQRLPSQLTVSIDTLPGGAGATAGTGAVAAAAVASAVGENAAAAVAANGGRHTAQTWRAGVVNVSRSCGLRRPVAEVMAEDALKLVKKWARDRGQGWKIIGMFLNASNFVAAPTGASTLDRFMAAAAGRQQQQQQQTGSAGPPSPATADVFRTGAMAAADGGVDSLTEVQTSVMVAAPGSEAPSNTNSTLAGTKRTAAAAGLNSSRGQPGGRNSSSRGGKRSYGDLRAFLGPSAATATAAESNDAAVITAAEPATNPQQQEQPDRSSPAAAAGNVAQSAVQSNTDAFNAASISTVAVPTVAASSSPAGQARSVLTTLSRLTPAAAAGLWGKQQQRQQPCMEQQQAGSKDQQQQELEPDYDVMHDDANAGGKVSAELPQACILPPPAAAAGGTEQQPSSLPSQIVGSLSGWLGTPQQHTQSQQQQGEGVQLDQFAPEDFEFKRSIEEQQQQQPVQHQEHQHTAALRGQCDLQQQQLPRDCRISPVEPGPAQTTAGEAGVAGGAAAWQHPSLRLSDIDHSVLAELPYDIQVEVRRAAGQPSGATSVTSSSSRPARGRGAKQNKHRPTGSIAKFFSKGK